MSEFISYELPFKLLNPHDESNHHFASLKNVSISYKLGVLYIENSHRS